MAHGPFHTGTWVCGTLFLHGSVQGCPNSETPSRSPSSNFYFAQTQISTAGCHCTVLTPSDCLQTLSEATGHSQIGQRGRVDSAVCVKGGLRHVQLLLLVSFVAVEARVLAEPSVHPAQALQDAIMRCNLPRFAAATTLATPQWPLPNSAARESGVLISMRDADSAAPPARECHHWKGNSTSPGQLPACSTSQQASSMHTARSQP